MDVTASGRRPLVIYALIALFWFGVAMSLLTAFLLLFPATPLDVLWRIKPEAKGDLVVFGYAAVLLMLMVAIACAFAAVGVTSRAEWGRLTAIAILSANLFGDCINVTLRAFRFALQVAWPLIIRLRVCGRKELKQNARDAPHS